ncbi:MAG: asparagine synthase (glutamine-hydrolyzing), partial [Gammaproteobacteria bacterium]|nr:asparagine synthase (glutamine-hydrolyzing) [Gammaproteobacteria bacterium]
GRQPMQSGSGRYCIVFNGEIYNFREIAADLKKLGCGFRGHSDTEVLLSAIETWGLNEALRRSVGMFAFALWDSREDVLYLCRDRMGEKPLYYGWTGKAFCFASELKAIVACASHSPDIETVALEHFLHYGYISAPVSIYRGIYKLPPGTCLILPLRVLESQEGFSPAPGQGRYSPVSYWSALESAQEGTRTPFMDSQEALVALERRLHEAVEQQLCADVKVGTFLSGGIDSTLVSAVAQHISDKPVRTYTIGFPGTEYDESGYALEIARHLGTDHLTMDVTYRDALDVVPALPEIYDEPFADSSQIPTFLVSRMAKQHVTVCLSGDGGDELFGGYNRYTRSDEIWNKYSGLPQVLRKLVSMALLAPPTAFWDIVYRIYTLLRGNRGPAGSLIGLKVQKLANMLAKKDIYEAYDYLLSSWGPHELVRPAAESCSDVKLSMQGSGLTGFINQAMYHDQVSYLPGDNLTKVDRASMAVSLETRLPLLDHGIVELSWRFPLEMKINNGITKWPLRQILYKYVPRQLIDRPKMGFSVPIATWLREDLREWAEDMLSLLDGNRDHLLCKQSVRQAWKEHVNGNRDHSHRLWAVLMYLSWLDFQQRKSFYNQSLDH